MRRMHVLSAVPMLALTTAYVHGQSFSISYTFATVADQNLWTITTNNDFNGPGVPQFGVPDATSVRIAPIDAGTKDTGDIRLYREVDAPAGFVFGNDVKLSGIGMGYSSHVTWADLLLSPTGDWGTSNTSPDVVRGRAASGYDEVPIVADSTGNAAYVGLNKIFLQIRIVDALGIGNPATNSPYARAITLTGDFIPGGVANPPEWNGSSGDWNNVMNWKYGVPNAVDAVAQFLGVITSPQTVYTNIPVTVGTLKFDNANTYVIAGAGSLTIQVSTGSGSVNVAQGSHEINLPLVFASNTTVATASGGTLTLADPTTIKANKTVTKNGNVVISAPLTLEAGASLVNGAGAMSIFGAPSLGSGAKIDLKVNSLTIDYRGQASPANIVKGQLTSGYNGGAWNGSGITTSAALPGQLGLGWKDNASSQSIQVKYTWLGDANLDGQVDVTDLGALATNWQASSIWSGGDFNYDGIVNVTDLGILATNWQAGVGSPLGPGSFDAALQSVGLGGVTVPEPAALACAGALALVLTRRRSN